MYIPNDDTQIAPSVYHYKWLKSLDTQLYEPTNQNLMKVTKVVRPTNKKNDTLKLWGLV